MHRRRKGKFMIYHALSSKRPSLSSSFVGYGQKGVFLWTNLQKDFIIMKQINKQQLLEQVVYLVIWLTVIFVPLVGDYLFSSISSIHTFSWQTIRVAWLLTLPFFLLFVVNNYLLAPRLLLRKRYWQYAFSLIGVIVLLFFLYPSFSRPRHRQFNNPMPVPPGYIYEEHSSQPPMPKRVMDPLRQGPYPLPGYLFGRFSLALLVVGFNVAIKLLFKSMRDEEALKELEHQHLQSELQYLKYQINPHFFMNTLNNIHALVDMDAGKAKKTIVELSKLMRYVLYEASNKTILLSREIQFLDNYITLMKLRYTNKVCIMCDMPGEIPKVQIPPLLFISFVENAFKHGVSYQKESFIRVAMTIEDGKLAFRCSNSNWGKSGEQNHGIGLENVRKRLRLLFGQDYTLSINEREGSFNVLLVIPLL